MSIKWDVWLKELRTMSGSGIAHEYSEGLWNLMYLTLTTHFLSKYVWDVYHRSGAKLGADNTIMNKPKTDHSLIELIMQWERQVQYNTVSDPSNHTHECRIKTALYDKKSWGKSIFIGSFHLVRDGGGTILKMDIICKFQVVLCSVLFCHPLCLFKESAR